MGGQQLQRESFLVITATIPPVGNITSSRTVAWHNAIVDFIFSYLAVHRMENASFLVPISNY